MMPATAQATWSSSLYIFSRLTPTAVVSRSCAVARHVTQCRAVGTSPKPRTVITPQPGALPEWSRAAAGRQRRRRRDQQPL